MKYRIEPKPDSKGRFRPLLETESLDEVRAWIANPPVPVSTRISGTDGTYHQLTTPRYHDIVVSSLQPCSSATGERMLLKWVEVREVSTVASRETEDGCRQIERWEGKPVGTYKPRPAFDR